MKVSREPRAPYTGRQRRLQNNQGATRYREEPSGTHFHSYAPYKGGHESAKFLGARMEGFRDPVTPVEGNHRAEEPGWALPRACTRPHRLHGGNHGAGGPGKLTHELGVTPKCLGGMVIGPRSADKTLQKPISHLSTVWREDLARCRRKGTTESQSANGPFRKRALARARCMEATTDMQKLWKLD